MKKDRLPLYDLSNAYFLNEDIEIIFDRIEELYDVKFLVSGNEYMPKTEIPDDQHWISNDATKVFNKLVPKLKSLTEDMYSIIEGIYKSKRGEFKKPELEKEFENLKEFRIFNNKIKHHNDREAEVNIVSLSMINGNKTFVDCYIQFTYPSKEFNALRFSDLIEVFLRILEAEQIITVTRK